LFLLCLGVSTVLEQTRLRTFRLSRCRFWNSQELIVSRIETLGHYFCWDFVFETVNNFLTVKMLFLKLSRISWLSRCRFWNCQEMIFSRIETSGHFCFWDFVFETIEIKNRDRNCVETNWDPPGLVPFLRQLKKDQT
jgi:hypothetical protein